MNTELYDKLNKALYRNQSKAEHYNSKYEGKEEQWTFHGGWKLGYWEGRVSALEGVLNLLKELDFLLEQEDLPPDMQKVLGDNFLDLLA